MKKNERIEVKLPNGDKLVAMIGQDPSYSEIFIGVEDKNGVWQDLTMAGADYEYDKDTLNVKTLDNKFRVLVWGDNTTDAATERIEIDKHIEEEAEDISIDFDAIERRCKENFHNNFEMMTQLGGK